MCTTVAIEKGNLYFGRTMDIEYSFGQKVVITPKKYPVNFRKCGVKFKHYAIIGMGMVKDNYPLYADAVNEYGLCMAALKFSDNAYYPLSEKDYSVSPYELILWVLCSCKNIIEAKNLMLNTNIEGFPFSDSIPLTPLHWHIADKIGSIVVEMTVEGIKIYDNPVGVLTNDPDFPFQLNNLRRFVNISPDFPTEKTIGNFVMKPFGNGFGAIGLSGDFSSPSRFVRTSFLKGNLVCGDNEIDCISSVFHILENVSLPAGSVKTSDGKYNITSYASCIDADNKVYYYRTYNNSRLNAVKLDEENSCGETLIEYPLNEKQDIMWIN